MPRLLYHAAPALPACHLHHLACRLPPRTPAYLPRHPPKHHATRTPAAMHYMPAFFCLPACSALHHLPLPPTYSLRTLAPYRPHTFRHTTRAIAAIRALRRLYLAALPYAPLCTAFFYYATHALLPCVRYLAAFLAPPLRANAPPPPSTPATSFRAIRLPIATPSLRATLTRAYHPSVNGGARRARGNMPLPATCPPACHLPHLPTACLCLPAFMPRLLQHLRLYHLPRAALHAARLPLSRYRLYPPLPPAYLAYLPPTT